MVYIRIINTHQRETYMSAVTMETAMEAVTLSALLTQFVDLLRHAGGDGTGLRDALLGVDRKSLKNFKVREMTYEIVRSLSLSIRGIDDKVYKKYPEIQNHVPRGFSIFSIGGEYFVLRGFRKFFHATTEFEALHEQSVQRTRLYPIGFEGLDPVACRCRTRRKHVGLGKHPLDSVRPPFTHRLFEIVDPDCKGQSAFTATIKKLLHGRRRLGRRNDRNSSLVTYGQGYICYLGRWFRHDIRGNGAQP